MFLMNPLCLIQLIVVLLVCAPLNEAQESDYIVGGVNVPPGAIPYQVALEYSGQHYCGGTILNNCWVLTAAHCVDQLPMSSFIVIAGTTKLNSGGVRVGIEKAIHHEHFNRPHTPNDIAVVKLAQCLTYSKYIQPVKLGTHNVGPGVNGIVSGWGFTDQNGKQTTNDLKRLRVRTISNAQCSRTFLNVERGNICAINAVKRGTCQGDSGGPLMEERTMEQMGLVSANIPCARGQPDLFTRISTYIPWIQKHIQ